MSAVPELVTCPACGSINDAAENTESGGKVRPDPGDLGICLSCANWFLYAATGAQPLDAEARAYVRSNPNMVWLQTTLLYRIRTGR